MKRSFSLILLASLAMSLASCDFAKNQLTADRSGNMEIQDYKDALAERTPDIKEQSRSLAASSSIPKLQPYISGSSKSLASMPLVSISVNQTVSLRDALYELAKQADYDLELDPRINGAIIFSAREKPLDSVIERISDVAGLRYKFTGETLRIELDTPYNHSYKIDYLSLVRTNSSTISTDVSVVSGDGADTGSSFESSFENEIDFWGELETSLQQILASTDTNILKTASDPQIQVTASNPNVEPVSNNGRISPPNVNLNIGSLPIGGGEGYSEPELSYSVNKQAGIVQVFAPERTHKKIAKYMKLLKKSVTSQVLIEAKILEVTLSDEYASGIDWNGISLLGDELGLSFSTASPATGANLLSINYAGNDLSSVVEAISTYGLVKALASPRLTVLNNQSAVMNIATNRVFFEIDIETTTEDGTTNTDVTSDIRNVPEGILVNVQPSIDLDKGTVSMALRPTITRVSAEIPDPGVNFAIATLPAAVAANVPASLVPQLNVQEIDTIVQMKSGQAIIMGGLLSDRTNVTENGIPGLSDIPIAGNLFKSHSDTIIKTELVIFLKATILDQPEDSIHNTDRDLYRKFSHDRRPFSL